MVRFAVEDSDDESVMGLPSEENVDRKLSSIASSAGNEKSRLRQSSTCTMNSQFASSVLPLLRSISNWMFSFSPWNRYHAPISAVRVRKKEHGIITEEHQIILLEPLSLSEEYPSKRYANFVLSNNLLTSNFHTFRAAEPSPYCRFSRLWLSYRESTAVQPIAENQHSRIGGDSFNFPVRSRVLSLLRFLCSIGQSEQYQTDLSCSCSHFFKSFYPLTFISSLFPLSSAAHSQPPLLHGSLSKSKPPKLQLPPPMASQRKQDAPTPFYPGRPAVDPLCEDALEALNAGFSSALVIPGENAREVSLSKSALEGRRKKFLVVKALADETEKHRIIESQIKNAFSVVAEVTVNFCGNATFSVGFNDEKDATSVLSRSPWTLNRGMTLLIIKELKPFQLAKEVVFDKALVWVQVHDIPEDSQTTKFSNSLLCSIGWPEHKTSKYHTVGNSTFSRTKVWIPLNQPLASFLVAKIDGGNIRFRTTVKYEKTGLICFKCARLGHSQSACWDQGAANSDPSKFRSLIAGPIQGSRAMERGKGMKGKAFGLTARNLLQDLEAEANLNLNIDSESVSGKLSGRVKGKIIAEGEAGTPSDIDKNQGQENTETPPMWSAKEARNFGTSFFKHGLPIFSLSPGIGLSLSTKKELILNMKRPLNWDVDLSFNDKNLEPAPLIKYGPKRNGPSKIWHQTKKSLGWESSPLANPDKSSEKLENSDIKSNFTEEEEETPSQWLSLANKGNGGTTGGSSEPSEYSQDTAGTSQPTPKRQRLEESD